MRTPTHSILILLISIFGLISCKSDKSGQNQEQETPAGPGTVEIGNPDQTFQKLKESQTLRINSDLILDVSVLEYYDQIQFESRCKTSFTQNELTHFGSMKFEKKIHSVNLLPAGIFSPTQKDKKREILCSIHLDLLSYGAPKGRVEINDVIVTGTMEYSNAELGFDIDDDFTIYTREELINMDLVAGYTGGDATLYCENTKFNSFSTQSGLKWEEILHESLFQYNNTEYCRMVITDNSLERPQISKAFYIQNKTGKLVTKELYNTSSAMKKRYKDEEFITLQISNMGKHKSLFKISSSLKGAVIASPLYYQAGTDSWFLGTEMHIKGQWMMEDLSTGEISPAEANKIYELEPGQMMELSLVINASWDCPSDLMNGFGACGSRPIFASMHYEFTHFPQISEANYSDARADSWRTHGGKATYKKRSDYARRYLINHEVADTCNMVDSFPRMQGIPPLFQSKNSKNLCR